MLKTNLNHSIHTVELIRYLSLQAAGQWKQKLYDLTALYHARAYENDISETIFTPFSYQGVTITLGTVQNHGYLKLGINLNSLLYGCPQRTALFYPTDAHIAALDCSLRCILQDAQLGPPEAFAFSRVDFSVDTRVRHPLAYIQLAYKTGIPRGYQPTYCALTTPAAQNRSVTAIPLICAAMTATEPSPFIPRRISWSPTGMRPTWTANRRSAGCALKSNARRGSSGSSFRPSGAVVWPTARSCCKPSCAAPPLSCEPRSATFSLPAPITIYPRQCRAYASRWPADATPTVCAPGLSGPPTCRVLGSPGPRFFGRCPTPSETRCSACSSNPASTRSPSADGSRAPPCPASGRYSAPKSSRKISLNKNRKND